MNQQLKEAILYGSALVFLVWVSFQVSEVIPKPVKKTREATIKTREVATATYLRCRDAGVRPDACEIEVVALVQSRKLDADAASETVRDLRAGREE